ncbi:hypothetical protein [Bdellovibrio sp. HCB2-146]|uniref:hypothetical protein n=1 Tax=Bdellovibrio sp. HCB2-146 TaxID=3394362 RepID=UPI0039BC2A7D
MNKLLKNINQAGVKTLGMGVLGMIIFSTQIALAADPTYSYNPEENCKGLKNAEMQQCLREVNEARSGTNTCKDALKEISDAKKEIGTICGEAGFGDGKQCIQDAIDCDDFITDDTPGGGATGLLAGAATTLTGLDIASAFKSSGSGGNCPQMGGTDYFEQKKILDDKLDDLKKESAELTEDIAKAKKDYQDNITQLQKDIQTAQEDLKKMKRDSKNALAEQIAEAARNADQAKNSLREAELKMVQLRSDLNMAQADQTKVMITFSDQSMKAACMKNVNTANEEFKKLYSSKSIGSGNLISVQKEKKRTLIATYNSCIASYQQQRIDGYKQAEARQRSLQTQIENLQGSIDDQRVAMQSANERMTQIQNDNQKEITEAEESVIQKMSMAQQEMQSASTNLQDNLTAIAQKQQANKDAIQRVNAQLADMTVGGVPKRGTKISSSEARSKISSETERIKDIAAANPSCPAVVDAANGYDGKVYYGGSSSNKHGRGKSSDKAAK